MVEELEPRILLSAGIHSALLGDVLSDAVALDYSQLNPGNSPISVANDDVAGASSVRNELIFVDAATPDYEQLVQQLLASAGDGRTIDVIVIDSGSDGITQISQALISYTNLDAIHFISHGTDGGVQLGDTWLNNGSLAGHAGLIAGWADALGEDADLLFYGCDLAAGTDGRALVAELAALTGADIAASSDLTGHASLGGDWVLEHQTGVVESQVIFGAKLQQKWAHALSVTVDNTSSGTDVNTDNITISHTTSGTNRLLLVAIASEPNGAESVSTVTYNGTALTLVGTHLNATTNVRVELWALVTPDTGTHDVEINLTALSKSLAVNVVSFEGVDQLNALGAFISAEGDSTNASVSVASSAGDLVFGFVGVRKGIDATPGAGQTEYADVNIANIQGASTTEDGAASVDTDWALDVSDKWIATGVSINAATQGLAIWNDNLASLPEFSTWNGTSFDPSGLVPGMPEWRIIQGAESPFGDEAIVVGVDSSNQVSGMIWNGSSWSALPINPLSTVSESFWWGFDVQYESQSGDAMLVWNNGSGGTASISYSIWNGTSWSAPTTITTPLGGEAKQMQLVANPNSDEMMLVVSNASSDDYALVWDGSSWGNAQVLETAPGDNLTDINVAYEQQSGNAMVVYGQGSSNARYQIWNGATWSGPSSITRPGAVTGDVRWVTLASDPTTDRIVLGVSTASNEMWLAVWDGSSWGASIEASVLAASGTNRPTVAVAFEGTSGEAVAAFSTSSTTVHFRTWTPGGGWSADTVGPNIMQSHNSIMLYADTFSDQIMLAVQDDGSDLHYALWDGTSWGAPTELETDTNENKNQPFLFLWDRGAGSDFSLWLADESSTLVEQFGGPGFSLENPGTAGSFAAAFSLIIAEPAATTNINALHYVGSTISLSGVGITSMTLNAGDIIFSVDGSDTLGGVSVTNEDLIVFRPTVPGDYSSGTFTILAAGLGAGKDITAFSLVETDTLVPGSGTLAAGDFIYVAGSGGDMRRIRHYDASTGLNTFILDGDVDATTGFKPGANVITGIELIESDITIGGRTLTAGQILISLTDDDVSVGNLSGNIGVTDEDIFVVTLVSASDFSASLLFDGSDVGYTGDVHALSIVGSVSPAGVISGTVYEDVNGDGDLADAVGVAGVDVDLYLDDGDGVINAGDTLVDSTTTDGSGQYTLTGTGAGTYWVVVDSTTIAPDAGFNGGFGIADIWAEQTWGSAGAVSFDGSFNYLGTSGVFYGGMQFEVSDDASALTTAEHVTQAIVSGANITNVDSAFSFNAITRTGDGDDDLGANRSMQGSLRQFIQNSNAIVGVQSTQFAIDISDSNHYYYRDDGIANSLSLVVTTTQDDAAITDFDMDYPVVGHSWFRIQPTSALPVITDPLIIDGYTQSGASLNMLPIGTDAVMKIEINGDLSGNANAFVLNTSNSTLRGLVINGDFNIGIAVNGNNNTISGNYIGTDITGTKAPTANFGTGLYVSGGASNNIIGGALAGDRNVISGTTSNAIWLLGSTTQGNTIRGNYIGTNALGDAAMAIPSNAIVLTDGTHDNTIQENLISGNNAGILLDGTISAPDSNTIIGNLIGTDATGTFAVANAIGIWLQNGVANTTIGGTNASQRNVISGNTTDGIRIEGAGTTGNVVLGNYIGTDISGTVGLGNGLSGIAINNSASANTIGGTAPGARNILAANTISGVSLTTGAFGNLVQGNYVGVDVSGAAALGHGFSGVRIVSGAFNNTIGGAVAGAGNVISGNSDGIYISDIGTTGNVVQGNLIGTDSSGTIDVGNADDGIEIISGASGNLIGGSVAAARNIISGNNGDGIAISGAGTTLNQVHGNYIGTDLSGNAALGNGAAGISIRLGATNNEIGDAGGNSGNIISGNASHGIVIRDVTTSGNTVEGNYIGTNAAGTAALGNGLQGVLINQGATGNFVGGTAVGARNVISGNLSTGVFIQNAGTAGNVVLGNYIGTNAAGDTAIGNGSGGVRISDFATGNIIGGAAAGQGNLISGNSWGVQIFANAFGNFVQGNLIGTDWTGTAALANTGQGVTIQSGANANTIGGTLAGQGNVIAYNTSSGVQITADSGSGNSILGNSIHANGGLGIEIMPWGVDANIVTLTSAVTDGVGTITIGGTITGAAPGSTYRIELFANVTGDPSGSGEGEIYLGFIDVVTDGLGNATFSVPLAAAIPPGYVISATATDPAGSTSEFAANIVAVSLPPVLDLDADDSSGATGADYITGYTENGGPVLLVDSDGTLIDPDTTLQWLTVTITNLLDGLAELLAADTSGTSIVANYDSLTGILTLSGADTAANYQQVLRTITYDNSSDDPDLTTRIIEFIANDGGSSSNLATTTLTIAAVNDAPTLTPATPSLPSITEDEISNGGIQISTLLGGSVSDPDTGAVQGIAITGLNSGNGAWEYSTDGGLTWIAVGSVSDSNALLLRATDYIRFVPDGLNAESASFDFRAWDQTSGLFGTKVDTGANGGITAFSTATDTAGITVTGVNEAPVLTPATPGLPPIDEDDVGNGGVLISTLLGSSVTDGDNGALEGIAVTGLNSSNGTWEYSTDGGVSWAAVGPVSDGNALLLRASDFIRFVPDGENADAASFDYRAWDQTSGLSGTKVDTSSNGGITAFSTATDTADITVTAVNDAPVLVPAAPDLPTIDEDEIYNNGIAISTLLGGSSTDVDIGSQIGIAITGLSSGNGTWQYSLDGSTWIDVPAVSDDAALVLGASHRIRFVPDGANADTASFTFRAWDWTGGPAGSLMDTTANGGSTPFSNSSDTASIDVTAVNDIPTSTGLSDVAVDEDSVPVVIDLYSAFSDVEDLDSQLTFSIAGNTDPSLFSGITIDAVSGTLTLSLTPDANGQTTITVRAVDTDGGQVETTFVLDIDAVNDAPFTTGLGTLSLLEDGPAATFDLYTLFGDIDDLNTSLTFTIVGNDNTVLTTANIDAATGTLNMNFGADRNGSSTITVRATDASGAFVDTDFLVTVDPVDDAVINVLPATQSVTYGQFVLFSSANGNGISVSDVDSANITVSLSVPNGLLTLGNTTGLTFSVGDGTGDVQMTFTGSISDVNAALDGLSYQPLADFDGTVALQVATWSPDLPPAQRAAISTDTINIVVLAALAPEPVDLPSPVDTPKETITGESNEIEPGTDTETETATPVSGTSSDDPAAEFAPDPAPVFIAPFEATPANEVPAPDNGSFNPGAYLSSVTRMLLQLSADAKLPAFVISDAVWDALDAMKDEIAGLDQAGSDRQQLLVTVSAGLTLTLSAGFVSWLMRASSLLTSLLSTTPLWQRFDPLPVLDGRRRDDDGDSDEKDDDAVKAIFGPKS